MLPNVQTSDDRARTCIATSDEKLSYYLYIVFRAWFKYSTHKGVLQMTRRAHAALFKYGMFRRYF